MKHAVLYLAAVLLAFAVYAGGFRPMFRGERCGRGGTVHDTLVGPTIELLTMTTETSGPVDISVDTAVIKILYETELPITADLVAGDGHLVSVLIAMETSDSIAFPAIFLFAAAASPFSLFRHTNWGGGYRSHLPPHLARLCL